MQNLRFPKLSLNLKKKIVQNCPDITQLTIDEASLNFTKLIPDTISKKIARIQRMQNKHDSSDINLRDGSKLKLETLLNIKTKSSCESITELTQDRNNSGHTLRKLRIASNIHSQLINFFSSSFIPKILRFDIALWNIVNVGLKLFILYIIIT